MPGLLYYFSPGSLAGIRMREWWRLLRESDFAIAPAFLPRAASISAASFVNSCIGAVEQLIYGAEIGRTKIPAPVFILGAPRSGTTLLHNLLSQDNRFCRPTLYQVRFPWTFLLTERIVAPLTAFLLPRKRAQDNVTSGWNASHEEGGAIAIMTLRGAQLGTVLPRRRAHFRRYRTMNGVPAAEIEEWKNGFLVFCGKLTVRYRRPLILKSPSHTCRIPYLLEMFPEARFVHLHRNPYEVVQSIRHTILSVNPLRNLQTIPEEDLDEQVIGEYAELFESYFAHKHRIPPGHLHELRYEDLVGDPLGQIARLYEALGLPEFEATRPAVTKYVDGLRGYERNVHREMSSEVRERFRERCGQWIEKLGYTV
jgi:hypothetical protein